MTIDDLPEGIEQAHVRNATNGTRFHDADGHEWVVLQSARDGSRELVRDDVVDYGRLDHPLVGGLAGFLTIIGALIAPISTAYIYSQPLPAEMAAGVLFVGIAVAFVATRVVLFYTPIGDQLFRFLEWRENQYLIMSYRESAAA